MNTPTQSIVLGQPDEPISRIGQLARGTLVFAGVVLCLSAFGLWLVPTESPDSGKALMRCLVSVLFSGTGLALFFAGRSPGVDEFRLDAKTGYLSHILRGGDGIARLQRRYALSELEELSLTDDVLIVRAPGGRELLRVALSGAAGMPDLNLLKSKFAQVSL